jgi:hypothetical protein
MKTINYIFLITISFVTTLCNAQTTTNKPPVKIWDKTFGGSEDDDAKAIISTLDGGFIIGGNSRSEMSDDKTNINKGCEDFWIIKINSEGQKVWDKTIGGNHFDYLTSIIPTIEGGFIVIGNSDSDISGDVTEIRNGSSDFWIMKFDKQGNKLWERMFGGSKIDNSKSIIATSDGGFLIGGVSNSDISGDKSEESKDTDGKKGSRDYWILKINKNGNKVWDKTYGGSGSDYLRSVVETTDGNFIIIGNSQSNISGDKTENSKGFVDLWILKIDNYGQKIWDRTMRMIDNYIPIATKASLDGGAIIVGYSNSNILENKIKKSPYRNTWIMKIDSQGETEWRNKLVGINATYPRSIIETFDKNYIIAGSSYTANNNLSNKDYWICKIDNHGNKIWESTFGGDDDDDAECIISSSDNNLLVVGTSLSNTSKDKSEKSRGNSDYWILKLGFQ